MDQGWSFFRLRRVKALGYVSMQLVSKISNLCDPDRPTSQTDRRTDRQIDGRTDGRHAISIPRYALVHRAAKTVWNHRRDKWKM